MGHDTHRERLSIRPARETSGIVRTALRRAAVLAGSALIFLCALTAQETRTLRGTVSDSATGSPLAAANLRIAGTTRGTISNTAGEFALRLEPSDSLVVVTYLGYLPETLSVRGSTQRSLALLLRPSPITMSEVLVLGEDPALEIIRKAIAHKHAWMDKLHSYRFEAYTRQVLRRDTAIASITEAFTTGFAARGDTMREIVRQKRQTSNIPVSQNFAAVRKIVNFNDDEVDLFNIRVGDALSRFTFVGPTAPDALDDYDYRLLKTRRINGVEIYEIAIHPKSRFRPSFDGTITIADLTFAVMGVDVRPTALQGIPFLSDIELRYRQEFSLVDSIFWMPTTIHITGGFSIAFPGLSLPRIRLEQLSSISDYMINASLPDSILRLPRVSIDSASVAYDSSYWKRQDILPLTAEEQGAYKTLDSAETLEKQFEPKGPLATLSGRGTETLFGLADCHFNRVEGWYLGASKSVPLASSRLLLQAGAGYGFSTKHASYEAGLTVFPLNGRVLGIGGSIYERIDHRPDGQYYTPFMITLGSVIDRNDYRDYYYARGYRVALSSQPTRHMAGELAFRSEWQESRSTATSFSVFSRSDPYRLNPPIRNGRLRAVEFTWRQGHAAEPIDVVTRNGFDLAVEQSSREILRSDFEYTRVSADVEWSFLTYMPYLLFPPQVRIHAFAGAARGELPPQRLFAADTRLGFYGPFGALHGTRIDELAGDRLAVFSVEHNFRSVPFTLAGISFLANHNIELLAHASAAQAWTGTTPLMRGWYAESGIGLARILELLRADVTYRFGPAHGFVFTMALSTLL